MLNANQGRLFGRTRVHAVSSATRRTAAQAGRPPTPTATMNQARLVSTSSAGDQPVRDTTAAMRRRVATSWSSCAVVAGSDPSADASIRMLVAVVHGDEHLEAVRVEFGDVEVVSDGSGEAVELTEGDAGVVRVQHGVSSGCRVGPLDGAVRRQPGQSPESSQCSHAEGACTRGATADGRRAWMPTTSPHFRGLPTTHPSWHATQGRAAAGRVRFPSRSRRPGGTWKRNAGSHPNWCGSTVWSTGSSVRC